MGAAVIGKTISATTVRRKLHLNGLYARVPRVYVPLSVHPREARLKWHRQYENWIVSDWDKVVFTDESRFAPQPDDKHYALGRVEYRYFLTPAIRRLRNCRAGGMTITGLCIGGSPRNKPDHKLHRTARLQWCREHHNWTEQDWACVLFSDESRFSLSSDCRRQLIWRESGIAYRSENIQEKDRYPTCSIMVWAGIMINGRTRLHVVANGTMTGQRFIDEVLLPHVRLFRGAVGDKFVFMDDNATCHRTLAVQDCLDSEGIQRLVWPARSPDLNPIENVWDALGRQVAGRNYPPTNKNTLIRALTEEWDKLPQQLLDNVVQIAASARNGDNQSVRRHLDAFTRGRIIGKLEEGRSVTSVAAEFGIANSIVSRLWRQLQTTGTAIRGFSSGRPRGTTPADDRYIVVQARRNRRQTPVEIARHTTQATGRPISRFTVARRLHGGGLFARRPVRCVPLTPAHLRRRSLWCREHRNWRDNEWGRVLFTDESKFSLSSDSHRILIWRERGSRNNPSNIIEKDKYGGRGVLVWGGIMLGSRTDLHIFDAGSVNGTRYCNEILLPYVRLFRGVIVLKFLFMDDNAPCHRTVAAEQLLESENIERMDWPERSPDLNPIEHVWDFLGRRLAARTSPPVTIRELRLALQGEWAAMPQQLIDTLILSVGRRCETCLAVRGDHIPY
ncbi:transposable element Tcb2 transposase [Trichonephila clavipes]|nr:transposable element Tcb2 transposase [Trichonephila clavipes]